MATMAHHLLAKTTTDAVLHKFKTGAWTYGPMSHGANFMRTGTPADFPSPDAAFYDATNRELAYFEFKPDTETKRGILTGVGQGIAYLQKCNLSYLIAPKILSGFNLEYYLTTLYNTQLATLPVGLIIYDNATPGNVRLIKNVTMLAGSAATPRMISVERFWAKHQDLPVPLFHLILHHYYMKKVGQIVGDAFEDLFTKKLVPPSVLNTLTPVPVYDVAGVIIKTVAQTKDIKFFEKRLSHYATLVATMNPKAPIEFAKMQRDIAPSTRGDTYYNSIRKNYLSFMKQMQMIDSTGELTERGLAMYNLGLVNGPTSKIFTDYFIKELLTTGHHLDVLLDFDEKKRSMAGASNDAVRSALETDYSVKGFIKTNPNRMVGTSSTVDFLKYEQILWKHLGLLGNNYDVQWRKITEICSLPDV